MKITKSVFLPGYEDTVIRDIYHDGKVTKGLLFVVQDKYVKRNLKTLKIQRQIPDDPKQIGCKFSKNNDIVILTCTMFQKKERMDVQFILKKELTLEILSNCNHYVLEGFRESIALAIDLNIAETLKDVKEWCEPKE